MPAIIVQLGVIGAVIVVWPSRFLAEQGMSYQRLRGPQSMMELSCPLELMEVLDAQMLDILLRHREQFEVKGEERFTGHVVGAIASRVLIHELFQPLEP